MRDEDRAKKEKNIFKKVLTKDKEKHIIKTTRQKEELKMTAREFVKEYEEVFGLAEDEVFELLDEFLFDISSTFYSESPDQEIVEFEMYGDLVEAFEEFLDKQLSKI